jgi:hypothetical protein
VQASTGSRSPATTTRASAIAALEDLRLTCAGTFAQNPEPFASHSNEIPDAVRRRVVEQFPLLGFKCEFAALWRAEAKQVPRGRAWYLHRFAVTDLSIRMAPFG